MAASILRSLSPALSGLLERFELDAIFTQVRALGDQGFYAWHDVPYARPASGEPHGKHHLDVYVPDGTVTAFPRPLLPTVLFVHGGAWQRGDRRHRFNAYGNVGIAAARAGAVGMVMSYRLSPDVRHPEHVRDVAAAVMWARSNAALFGGDPGRLFLVGHSAGAHLAFLLLTQPQWLRESGAASCDDEAAEFVRGVVGLSGVYNLPRLGNTPLGAYLVDPVFGEEPAAWRAASPTHHISPECVLARVPVLLVNAVDDFNLEQDAEELESRLHLAYAATHSPAGAAEARPQSRKQVSRRVVPGNHVTLIGAVGQPGDPTTELLASFVHEHSDAT